MKKILYLLLILLLTYCQSKKSGKDDFVLFPIKKVDSKGSVGGKYGFMDSTGKILIDFIFENTKGFSQYTLVLDKNYKWGYIDKQGKYVIQAQFDEAFAFAENGLARVKVGKNWGFININGEFVVKPQFEQVGPFSEGLAAIRFANNYGYINEKGELAIPPTLEYWSDLNPNETQPSNNEDENPQILNLQTPNYKYQDEFIELQNFSEGLAAISIKGKLGFIDKTGKMVISPKFTHVSPFYQGKSYVTICKDCQRWENKGNQYKMGIIDKKGNFIIEPTFEGIGKFVDGIAPATISSNRKGSTSIHDILNYRDKLGYIDMEGKWAIEPKFTTKELSNLNKHIFSEGLAFVCINDTCGYINKKGEFVIPKQYFIVNSAGYSEAFSEGLAAVRISNMGDWIHTYQDEGKDEMSLHTIKKSEISYVGFIDKSGKFVIAPRFKMAYPFFKGVAGVRGFEDCDLESSCYINKKGEYIYYDSLAVTRYILK